jgi:lipid-A-disaccharide synthase
LSVSPLVFLIAGETSGDVLGGRLMAALKEETAGKIRFAGVGGREMKAEGLDSLFPMAELSIMGLAEVLPHLPRVMRRLKETTRAIRWARPDALVTIDSPGFNFRVARRMHGAGIPLIHYVAPSVWAWRPGRARKIARFLDHLLALFPFEPPYFEREGLPCSFVGHPVVESGADRGDGAGFRARHRIPETAPLLCLLPGSRHGETARLLPIFHDVLALLAERFEGLHATVPTVGSVAADVAHAAGAWPVPTVVVEEGKEKYDAFAAADVALAASGTVALELGMAQTPSIITYKVNAATAWVARRLLSLRFVSPVNILLEREVMPELLQDDCRPDLLADAVGGLLEDDAERGRQKAAMREALAMIGHGGPSPSKRAARVVLNVIREYAAVHNSQKRGRE